MLTFIVSIDATADVAIASHGSKLFKNPHTFIRVGVFCFVVVLSALDITVRQLRDGRVSPEEENLSGC